MKFAKHQLTAGHTEWPPFNWHPQKTVQCQQKLSLEASKTPAKEIFMQASKTPAEEIFMQTAADPTNLVRMRDIMVAHLDQACTRINSSC